MVEPATKRQRKEMRKRKVWQQLLLYDSARFDSMFSIKTVTTIHLQSMCIDFIFSPHVAANVYNNAILWREL